MRGWVLSGLVAGLAGAACFADAKGSDDECPVGSAGCACTDGDACDDGLDCLSNVCVDPDGTSGNAGDQTDSASETPATSGDASSTGGNTSTKTDQDGTATATTTSVATGTATTATTSDVLTTGAGGPYGACPGAAPGECESNAMCASETEDGRDFSVCVPGCNDSGDCPAPAAGAPSPTCADGGCRLPCAQDGDCPAGMKCQTVVSHCMWPG